MSDKELLREFTSRRIITVMRGIEKEKILPVAEALFAGGIRFAEVPFDQSDAAARQLAAEEIALLREHFDGRMHIGAGTVLNTAQLEAAHAAGAELIVSPVTVPSVIAKTKEYGLLSVPGAFTPTEMFNAHEAGADLIKIFPAGGMSLKTAKEILVPFSHLKLVFFGGVTADTLEEIFAAGVAGVGVASAILQKDAIRAGDYQKITELAKKFTEKI